jgi:hypothetical protein
MMKGDIFKSLGITVGEKNLIDQGPHIQVTEDVVTHSQALRKGVGQNARDMLEGHLSKGMAMGVFKEPEVVRVSPHAEEDDESPQFKKEIAKEKKADEKFRKQSRHQEEEIKDTHAESFHSDAKKMDEDQDAVIEVDRMFDGPSRKPKVSTQSPWKDAQDGEKEYRYEFKSLTQDELFIKGIDCEKAKKAPSVNVPKRAPRPPKDPREAKMERQQKKELGFSKSELDECFDLIKGKMKDSLIDVVPEKTSKKVIADVHENSPGVLEKKPSGEVKKRIDGLFAKKKSFVKSVGPGGMVFDFGGLTGNPLADRATALLQQHADPIQEANAQYQKNAYDKAVNDYTVKGDTEYMKTASPFGNVDQDWQDQLNKPMDQQVKEAFEKGMFEKDSPAVKNDFNKTEIQMGGQTIKATSETDAALIEMMKAERANVTEGGNVADCSAGGAIRVIAGVPLEGQLPAEMLPKN